VVQPDSKGSTAQAVALIAPQTGEYRSALEELQLRLSAVISPQKALLVPTGPPLSVVTSVTDADPVQRIDAVKPERRQRVVSDLTGKMMAAAPIVVGVGALLLFCAVDDVGDAAQWLLDLVTTVEHVDWFQG
jgi:hypothetical protein